MNFLEKVLYFLQGTMETPKAFGWFHLIWIFLIVISIFILYKIKNKYNEKQLKTVLFIYGIVALVLEIIKQIIWTFNYDPLTNIVTWNYQWYSFPFQLCTTPIFVSLICVFLKNNKIRKSLLSYIAFITIIGSFVTIIMPNSCFVEMIEINIHTMWLHCGSFVLSIYLLMSGEVELSKKNLKNAFMVFLVFVFIAEILNIAVYNTGILNDETFNMFYISPYFVSTLPIFDIIWQNVPYIIYLLIYIIAIGIGSIVVYYSSTLIKWVFNKKYNYTKKLQKK